MLTVKLKPRHRLFCFSVKGHVKMLRLDIINSVVTAVFMVVISVLALIPETTTYIVLGGDLINSFITAVFLFVVAILAMEEKERSHLFYVGGSLCLTAAIVCLIDATVVTKTMRNTMKKALGIKTKTSASPAQEPISPSRVPPRGSPRAPTRATMKQRGLSEPPSEAPSRAPSRAPSQAPSSSPSRR
ncbi:CKLF-like MARVEL transmembrane domain-containing protein 1 [Delphinapterus leucas]|uniref:CKLF-like MARVEL transmembrane domain-containing protein 1 n=1 Tax=Delphinapterus leucas TaxID=9749 RepID=A0A7F8K7V2_DELLE|nr:CKLF-like MARVEL transmembrane domain-containing protein 1 [Delphinapterus leucas]